MSETIQKIIGSCEPIKYSGNTTGCLLLHGFTSSPFELRFLADYLHKKNFTVQAPLLPGHGLSPEFLKNINWQTWYAAAKNELFELRKQCSSVFIIGQSMGALLALHLSAHYQVNGVAALSPALQLQNRFASLSHLIHKVYPFYKKSTGPDIHAEIENIAYDKIPLKAVSQLLKLSKHIKDDLQDIYIPVLIIYARQDHVVSPKGAVYIYERLSSKEKRILALDESFHIMTLDVEKEIVFTELNKFILRSK